MSRTTQKDLDGMLDLIKCATKDERYYIQWAYGAPRLEQYCTKDMGGGSRDISPRLRSGLLYDWMYAFLSGVRIGQNS